MLISYTCSACARAVFSIIPVQHTLSHFSSNCPRMSTEAFSSHRLFRDSLSFSWCLRAWGNMEEGISIHKFGQTAHFWVFSVDGDKRVACRSQVASRPPLLSLWLGWPCCLVCSRHSSSCYCPCCPNIIGPLSLSSIRLDNTK